MNAVSGLDRADKVVPIAPGTESLEAFLQPLRGLLADDVTEVCVNRPGEAWTEASDGWRRHEIPQLTFAHLRQLASLTAHAASQAINDASPVVSVALPTGERVQVIVPPACEPGTVSFTIRKPSSTRFSMDDYDRSGFFQHIVIGQTGLLDFEEQLLEHLAARRFKEFFALAVRKKQTIIVSGATGSGKTTFMKALVDEIPAEERLITVEDTPELSLEHQPNHVRLFYSKGGQSLARLTAGELVESGMRMKPDRLILAELRDQACYYFLEAANTGHPGSISSLHANNEQAAIGRMVTLARKAPEAKSMSDQALRELVLETIDVIVQVGRAGSQRAITGIYYDPRRKRALLG